MNQMTETWTEPEKQAYLTALSYIMSQSSIKSLARKEFIKNKAREVNVPMVSIEKIKNLEGLIKILNKVEDIKTKRTIVRDMILMALADHDLSDAEMKMIYEISNAIGLKSEKIDDFFLWAAKGLEWQIEGSRLISEDI